MAARLIPLLLLALHAALLAWALLGLAEYCVAETPWPTLANPLFPPWLQLAQWLVVLAASIVFLLGFALRWPALPWAMVAAYGAMAAVCALQTMAYLQHSGRYLDMALEYGAYLSILAWLFWAPAARRRFTSGRGSVAALR
jgi:hypothetical protein